MGKQLDIKHIIAQLPLIRNPVIDSPPPLRREYEGPCDRQTDKEERWGRLMWMNPCFFTHSADW